MRFLLRFFRGRDVGGLDDPCDASLVVTFLRIAPFAANRNLKDRLLLGSVRYYMAKNVSVLSPKRPWLSAWFSVNERGRRSLSERNSLFSEATLVGTCVLGETPFWGTLGIYSGLVFAE